MGGAAGADRRCPRDRELDVEIVMPVDDRTAPDTTDREGHPTRSIWPSVYPTILDLIRAHRSTIVFSNTDRNQPATGRRTPPSPHWQLATGN
jgi:ATP-dependent Lhr-like helicase